MLVQAVGERVRAQFDRPWGETPRATRLVAVAEHHDVDPAGDSRRSRLQTQEV